MTKDGFTIRESKAQPVFDGETRIGHVERMDRAKASERWWAWCSSPAGKLGRFPTKKAAVKWLAETYQPQ